MLVLLGGLLEAIVLVDGPLDLRKTLQMSKMDRQLTVFVLRIQVRTVAHEQYCDLKMTIVSSLVEGSPVDVIGLVGTLF